MIYRYEWRKGSRISGVKPEDAAAEFEAIKRKHGSLKPEFVVRRAKSKRSPLHRCFDWDNRQAAEQWRLHQARTLIQSLTIRVLVDPKSEREFEAVRAYVTVEHEEHGSSYVHLVDAMRNEDWRSQMLERARAELVAFKRKYALLTELCDIFEAIDKLAG